MTREQQVALDAMREAWAPEVVERMLRDTLFVANGNGEGPLGVYSTLEAAKAAVQLLYNDRVEVRPLEWVTGVWDWTPSGGETVVNYWRTTDEDRFGSVEEVVIDRPFAFSLSPAETPAAASVHRPVCHCGDYIDEHRGMSHNHGPVELLMGEDGRG